MKTEGIVLLFCINDESDLRVRGVKKTEVIVLLFCVNEHCLEKCSLKSSFFFFKIVYEVIVRKQEWN